MSDVKHTLFVFGVHDTRDISCTKLFADILDTQGWLHRDCLHWVERDGLLVILNHRANAKLSFKVDSPDSFTCVVAAMVHPSLPF